MINTQNLSRLPDIEQLRKNLQAMAMLDAILSPDWDGRYYSFNAAWGDGEQLSSMRNGSGDSFFAVFDSAGCLIKGFAHEAPMSPFGKQLGNIWPGVLESVPTEFAKHLKEPAFVIEETTFCIWRRCSEPLWQRGAIKFPADSDPDGSGAILSPLDGKPKTYRDWAKSYYEVSVKLDAVQHVFEHRKLTKGLVRGLNSDLSLNDLEADILEIGYGKGDRG